MHRALTARFAAHHDASLRRALSQLVSAPPTHLFWDVVGLPFSRGGLGLRSAVSTTNVAYWSSWADSLQMIQRRHPSVAGQILRQQVATDAVHTHVVETSVRPLLNSTEQAMLRSQGGPLSGVPFQTNVVSRFVSSLFRILFLHRLWLPLLPLLAAVVLAVSSMSLATTVQLVLRQGVWSSRYALESAAPLFHGAQLAIDTTLVPLWVMMAFLTLGASERLEQLWRPREGNRGLTQSSLGSSAELDSWCSQVRWAEETQAFLRQLAKAKSMVRSGPSTGPGKGSVGHAVEGHLGMQQCQGVFDVSAGSEDRW